MLPVQSEGLVHLSQAPQGSFLSLRPNLDVYNSLTYQRFRWDAG